MVTHVYVLNKECLHITSRQGKWRVRWMKDLQWLLRWDAQLLSDRTFETSRIDGLLIQRASVTPDLSGDDSSSRDERLLQIIHEATKTLLPYPVHDLATELTWFTLD